MLNKGKNFSLICLLVFIFFNLLAKNSSTPLKEFTNELKSVFDTTKTISLELALSVLQYGYEICTVIEKIKPEIASQLGIECQGCKNKILSCAEFSGCLLACGGNKNKDQLDHFKKLLFNPEVEAINLFMMSIANEKQIKCPMCEKFVYWGPKYLASKK
jgi:hypothetical protein